MSAFVDDNALERQTVAMLDDDSTRVLPACEAANYRLR
jgi:hypothetical protein